MNTHHTNLAELPDNTLVDLTLDIEIPATAIAGIDDIVNSNRADGITVEGIGRNLCQHMTAAEWSDDQVAAAIRQLEESDRADVRAVRDSIRDARDAQRGWGNIGAMMYVAEGQVAAGLRTRDSLARFRKRTDVLHHTQQWDQIDTETLLAHHEQVTAELESGGFEPLDRTQPFPPTTTAPGQGLQLRHAALSAYLHDRIANSTRSQL